jgi:hypothetical protein
MFTVLLTLLLLAAPTPSLLASVTCQAMLREADVAVGSSLLLLKVTERRAAW